MKPASFFVLLPTLASSVFAADWPQYHGPNLNNTANEELPSKAFPKSGPPQVWKAETSLGFSSFVVAEGMAVTLEQREIDGNSLEVVVARNAANGEEIWAKELFLSKYDGGGQSGAKGNDGGDGPRVTPTISDGKVYVTDAHLKLYSLNLADGEEVWQRDIIKQFGGQNIKWQNAAAPVVDGPLVFAAGGGKGKALIALSKDSGETVWAVEDDAMTHATPVVGEILGQRQVIFFTQTGLVSLDPASGKSLWRYNFPYKVSTAASPVIWGDIVYCSAGYGVGAGAAKIEKDGAGFKATEIWRTENDNVNHWSTPVVHDGYLYGMFGFKEYGEGPLACVDIRTGKQKWSHPGFGPGNVILAGQQLLALSDSGELVIVAASPDGYRESARADVLEGKCWSTPALADGKVYVRSTVEGGCFDLRASVSLR